MVARIAAIAATVLLGLVVAFQVALVLGAPFGAWTQGGIADGALPASGRIVAFGSAVVLLVFILGLLGRVGLGAWARHRRTCALFAWLAIAYGGVAVVLNAATPSGAERAVWLPYSLVLLALELVTVLGSRRAGGRSRSS